jgi:hypothetical protein
MANTITFPPVSGGGGGGTGGLCCGETIMTEISYIADDIGTRHWPQRDRTVWGLAGWRIW